MAKNAKKVQRYVIYGQLYEPNRPDFIDRWVEAKMDHFLSWFFPTPRKDGSKTGWFSHR